MATLLITLPDTHQALSDPATQLDYVLSGDGVQVQSQGTVPLDVLPRPGGQTHEVVVLVPMRCLSWHRVALPKGSLKQRRNEGHTMRLRAILAGLLEEQVLDETPNLHFSLAPQPSEGDATWVAVCDKTWLGNACLALEQAAYPISRIVPEWANDTLGEALYVQGLPERAELVCRCGEHLVCLPLSQANVAWVNWPITSPVVAEPAVAALAEQFFARPITLQSPASKRLLALQSAWDLAQFELAHTPHTRRWKRWQRAFMALAQAPRWQGARWALGVIVVANLLGLNLLAQQARAHNLAQRLALHTLLKSTFPHVTVVVDAPLQMAREVALLQQASGAQSSQSLEAMLHALAAHVSATPTALDYHTGQLQISGIALSSTALAELNRQLQPQGYALRIQGERLLMQQHS